MILKEIIKGRYGSQSCLICGGVGILLNEYDAGIKSPALEICKCISEGCLATECKGNPPYMVYDFTTRMMNPCICQEARIHRNYINKLIKISGIPSRYQFRFLENIDTSGSNTISLLAAHDWANQLITEWNQAPSKLQGMYLWGGTGSGKTLLACSILNELMFRYEAECRYAKINRDFLNALKDSYSEASESYGREKSIEEEFASVDVLVIDDFGIQKDTPWVNMKMYDLIDARYERQKVTLLTSNSPLIEWKEKGMDRVYSRLMENCRELHLDCPDYRLKHTHGTAV